MIDLRMIAINTIYYIYNITHVHSLIMKLYIYILLELAMVRAIYIIIL